ncbi:MAG: hypothetical protein ACFFD5_04065 [Candidatus Thorarchaeota archaeon]
MIASFPPMLYPEVEGEFYGRPFYQGFNFFYVGGSVIFFLFLLSILFVFLLRVKLGLIFGVIGCLIMGINMFFPSVPSVGVPGPYGNGIVIGYTIAYGYYIQFIIWILFCVVNIILFLGKVIVKGVNFRIIKTTILDLGTQYANLEVREISEACKADKVTIIDTIQNMIENNEIYAEYFKSSKTVAFNKQANIKEIDNLMAMYQVWEEGQEGKV